MIIRLAIIIIGAWLVNVGLANPEDGVEIQATRLLIGGGMVLFGLLLSLGSRNYQEYPNQQPEKYSQLSTDYTPREYIERPGRAVNLTARIPDGMATDTMQQWHERQQSRPTRAEREEMRHFWEIPDAPMTAATANDRALLMLREPDPDAFGVINQPSPPEFTPISKIPIYFDEADILLGTEDRYNPVSKQWERTSHNVSGDS